MEGLAFAFCLFACVLPALVVGCVVPQIPSRVIYEDPANFVRLQSDPSVLPELPESQHSHPAAVSTEEMVWILRGLRVREHRIALHIMIAGETKPEAVFREEEVALLAPRLTEALEKAEPNERVAFYLSRPQTSIKREVTSGGLYVRGRHLHFILGNHRVTYGIPAYGMVYDRRYPMRPTAAKGFDLFFEPAEVVVPQESRILNRFLGQEKDEVVLNLLKLRRDRPVAGSERPATHGAG